jgi:aryl-alcohol dehydrogenase-like predicted oxidoreductase
MRGLDDLVRTGKILYPAISDTPAWVIAQSNTMADLRGWSPFVANQVEYNLLQREAERDLIPMSKAFDIAVVAWSPLSRGQLTGKYLQESDAARGRMDTTKAPPPDSRQRAIIETVVRIASEIDATPAQVALAWTIARNTIPIIGATKLSQLDSNIAALDVALNDAQMNELAKVSAIDRGFPHNFPVAARPTVYAGFHDRLVMHREQGEKP